MKNTLEITVSGFPRQYVRLPNGNLWRIRLDGKPCDAWGSSKNDRLSFSSALNVLNIEEFEERTFPVVEFDILDKGVGMFKKWIWGGVDDEALYDVKITKVGEKKVTFIRTISGRTYLVDQSYEEVKSVVDGARLDRNLETDK